MGECQRILHPTPHKVVVSILKLPTILAKVIDYIIIHTLSSPINGCEDCYFWCKASSPKAIEYVRRRLNQVDLFFHSHCILLHWELLFSRSLSCFCSQMGAFLQDERVESLWQQLLESVQIGVLSTKAGKISNWRGGQTFSVIQFTELFKYLS